MKNVIVITIILLFPIVLLAQWEPDVRLTNNPFDSKTSYNNAWCIASNGSNIHVVWYDYRDANYEIYYKRSLNNGTNWSEDVRLTNNSAVSEYPSIAVSGLIVHVVWTDERDGSSKIYYKRSLDNGVTWSTDIALTTTSSEYPSIAVSGSTVHVTWTWGNVYYKRSLDNGGTWSTDIALTTTSSTFSSIAVSGSTVHVVWEDYRDGNWEIYYKRSLDNGVTWNIDTRLTNNSFLSMYPSIAVSGSNVHVVWTDYRDASFQIYYKRSLDNGTTWSADIRITGNTSYAICPSIAVSGSCVHVVWEDRRYWIEIYYKRSLDNGGTWSSDINLNNNASSQEHASIAIYGSCLHVVWRGVDGNWEIYYKRNLNGNGIEQQNTYLPVSNIISMSSLFENKIVIKFSEPIKKPLRITLYDISGASIFSANYTSVYNLLNVSNAKIQYLAPGAYFLRVDLSKQTDIFKLIKFK